MEGIMKRVSKGIIPALAISASVMAQDLQTIKLEAPDTTGGKPLMQALKERRSTREYSTDTLTTEQLSNLLWAAGGINRPEDGRRTAPSARNWQEIEIYVVRSDGAYRYDPKQHALEPVATGDFRKQTGMQEFVEEAPINLVFVADYAKMGDKPETDEQRRMRDQWAAADAAFMAQNVYLYCASAGLATVVRGSVDRVEMAKILGLGVDQEVVLAQTVGNPKE